MAISFEAASEAVLQSKSGGTMSELTTTMPASLGVFTIVGIGAEKFLPRLGMSPC